MLVKGKILVAATLETITTIVTPDMIMCRPPFAKRVFSGHIDDGLLSVELLAGTER